MKAFVERIRSVYVQYIKHSEDIPRGIKFEDHQLYDLGRWCDENGRHLSDPEDRRICGYSDRSDLSESVRDLDIYSVASKANDSFHPDSVHMQIMKLDCDKAIKIFGWATTENVSINSYLGHCLKFLGKHYPCESGIRLPHPNGMTYLNGTVLHQPHQLRCPGDILTFSETCQEVYGVIEKMIGIDPLIFTGISFASASIAGIILGSGGYYLHLSIYQTTGKCIGVCPFVNIPKHMRLYNATSFHNEISRNIKRNMNNIFRNIYIENLYMSNCYSGDFNHKINSYTYSSVYMTETLLLMGDKRVERWIESGYENKYILCFLGDVGIEKNRIILPHVRNIDIF